MLSRSDRNAISPMLEGPDQLDEVFEAAAESVKG
jgi:hypothetical protein